MINWNAINTVLLDMDGTLLDLHFDNYFWQEYVPQKYAEKHRHNPHAVESRTGAPLCPAGRVAAMVLSGFLGQRAGSQHRGLEKRDQPPHIFQTTRPGISAKPERT